MHNSDLRAGGDGDEGLLSDDPQVERCFKLSKRWEDSDKQIANDWWGARPKDRSEAAIARRRGHSRTKVNNRITWMRDCVIQDCVKNVNIYPDFM